MNNPTPNKYEEQKSPPQAKKKGSTDKRAADKEMEADKMKEKETGERTPYPDTH